MCRALVPRGSLSAMSFFSSLGLSGTKSSKKQAKTDKKGGKAKDKKGLQPKKKHIPTAGTPTESAVDDDGTQAESSIHKKRTSVKRRKPQPKKAGGGNEAPEPPGKAAMREFVTETCKTGVAGLLDEFNEIKKNTQAIGNTPKHAFDKHPEKNRYKDVYCVDDSRVVLQTEGGLDDYIHANWATTADGRKYICTQGPTMATIDDFWRMVWQEKSKAIVMLCNVLECGKKKCEQYWPENIDQEHLSGSLTIKATKKEEFESIITITELSLSDGATTHTLEHMQWNNWPDRGVPKETLTCLKLITRLKTLAPAVIHCSAGIGRTGTIVGLDMMYTKLLRGEYTPLRQVVTELRAARHGSVQTDIQYIYMHRVLIDIAISRKVVTEADVKEFVEKYDELCKLRGS